jgi:hypothetical protein
MLSILVGSGVSLFGCSIRSVCGPSMTSGGLLTMDRWNLQAPASDAKPNPQSIVGTCLRPTKPPEGSLTGRCLGSFCNGLQTSETAQGGRGDTERHERGFSSARHGTGRHETAPDGTSETRLRA